MPSASAFIGREDERARLRDLVAKRPMVTVVGPGGMGKTRLAVETCADLEVTFSGRIWRCELIQIATREEIGPEVAGQLGFASLESLAVGIGGGAERGLLVLDNCEHVLGAAARLCAQLLETSPSLHVLATSRESLGIDGEHLLVLGPLALPSSAAAADVAAAAATRLFSDRAQAAGAERDDSQAQLAAVVELCRRLDGVPLAIELAAARARSLTAVELLARLDRRFDLLQRSSPVGRSRHRSLRAAIDTSYDLLEPHEQTFFRALGVFAAPFAAELAHAVVASPERDLLDTLDLLARLVDRSLVIAEQQAGTTRYRLLDSLRHYAVEQATAAGEWEGVTSRFVNAMLAEADRIVTIGLTRWSPQLLASVLTQFGSLVAAVDRCVETDANAERALRLLLPMWGGIHQGRAGEVAATCDRVLARWPEGAEPLRAVAGGVAATSHLVDGRIERARELANSVLQRTPPASLAGIMALRALGIIARHEGKQSEARDRFRQARDAASEAGISAFALELTAFAESWVAPGESIDGPLATLAQVEQRARADADSVTEVWARLVITYVLLGAGHLEEARQSLATAERVQQGFEYPYGTSVILRLNAVLVSLESGWETARAAWLAAIDQTADTGALGELAQTLRTAATMAARAGDVAAATALREAVPDGDHIAVLSGLLEDGLGDERQAMKRSTAGASSSRSDSLRRVRQLLGEGLRESRAASEPPGAHAAAAAVDEGGGIATEDHAQDGDERADEHGGDRRRGGVDVGVFHREGDVWRIEFARATAHVKHSRGLGDLAVLLSNPGEEIHSVDLMNGIGVGRDQASEDPMLDGRALAEYRRRLAALDETIEEAAAAGATERGAILESERSALIRELKSATGMGGRARSLRAPDERARKAVSGRIRDSIGRIRAVHPELGRHLDESIVTGTFCSYAPKQPVRWLL